MNPQLARDGLTVARAHLLWELRRSGAVTQRALSEVMRVSPRNLTGLVDALVTDGFVTREAHPRDRRATLVTFTERGQQAADTLARQQRELADELFAGVTEESVAQLVAEVRPIVGVLSRRGAGAVRCVSIEVWGYRRNSSAPTSMRSSTLGAMPRRWSVPPSC